MTFQNVIASALQFLILMGFAVTIYVLLLPSLKRVLDEVLRLPAGTTFYLRSFAIVLALIALEEALSPIELKPGARFMEFAWAEASALSDILDTSYVVLLVYLGFITVLAVVLRGRHVQ